MCTIHDTNRDTRAECRRKITADIPMFFERTTESSSSRKDEYFTCSERSRICEYVNQQTSARHASTLQTFCYKKCRLITGSGVLLQKLTVTQLVNKFPVLHGTPKSITLFREPAREHHPGPYWSSSSQGNTNTKHKKEIDAPLPLRPILISSHLRLGLPSGPFVFRMDFFIYLYRTDGLQGANQSYCDGLCYDTVQSDCWASTFHRNAHNVIPQPTYKLLVLCTKTHIEQVTATWSTKIFGKINQSNMNIDHVQYPILGRVYTCYKASNGLNRTEILTDTYPGGEKPLAKTDTLWGNTETEDSWYDVSPIHTITTIILPTSALQVTM
jgi:hypothetical protein